VKSLLKKLFISMPSKKDQVRANVEQDRVEIVYGRVGIDLGLDIVLVYARLGQG
jgi:hypothetical protein